MHKKKDLIILFHNKTYLDNNKNEVTMNEKFHEIISDLQEISLSNPDKESIFKVIQKVVDLSKTYDEQSKELNSILLNINDSLLKIKS